MNCSFKTRRSSALKNKVQHCKQKHRRHIRESHSCYLLLSRWRDMMMQWHTKIHTHNTHTHTNPCRMITASFDFPRGFCFNKCNCQLKNGADTDEGRTALARSHAASIWLFPPCNIWNSPRGSEGDWSGSALPTWKWAIVKVLPSTSPKKLTVFTVQHQLLHRKSCWWMRWRRVMDDMTHKQWDERKQRDVHQPAFCLHFWSRAPSSHFNFHLHQTWQQTLDSDSKQQHSRLKILNLRSVKHSSN